MATAGEAVMKLAGASAPRNSTLPPKSVTEHFKDAINERTVFVVLLLFSFTFSIIALVVAGVAMAQNYLVPNFPEDKPEEKSSARIATTTRVLWQTQVPSAQLQITPGPGAPPSDQAHPRLSPSAGEARRVLCTLIVPSDRLSGRRLRGSLLWGVDGVTPTPGGLSEWVVHYQAQASSGLASAAQSYFAPVTTLPDPAPGQLQQTVLPEWVLPAHRGPLSVVVTLTRAPTDTTSYTMVLHGMEWETRV